METSRASSLPPLLEYPEALVELRAISQRLEEASSNIPSGCCVSPNIDMRVMAIASTLSEPCFLPAVESLRSRLQELRSHCPRRTSIDRAVLCFLMAEQLKEQASWVSKGRPWMVEKGRQLLDEGKAFLFRELFSRIEPERAVRYLLWKEEGQASLAECIQARTNSSLAHCIKTHTEWTHKREDSFLGTLFAQCLHYGYRQEASDLAQQEGPERCFQAFISLDKHKRTPLLYLIEKSCLEGVKWIEQQWGQENCCKYLLEANPLKGKEVIVWSLQRCSRPIAEWMKTVIGKEQLVQQLCLTEVFRETHFFTVLKECRLDIAEWMGNLLGKEATLQKLEHRHRTELAQQRRALVFPIEYLTDNGLQKAEWLAEQLGEATLRSWLANIKSHQSFIDALISGRFEANERVLAWMTDKLEANLLQQALTSNWPNGLTLLIHCLVKGQLKQAQWIAKQLTKDQLLVQFKKRNAEGYTVLMQCVLSGCIDSATQIVEWLGVSRESIVEQLESENEAGRNPLLELFHRNRRDSSKIDRALPWIEQWLNKESLAKQLEKTISFGTTDSNYLFYQGPQLLVCLLNDRLGQAQWIAKQLAKEQLLVQLDQLDHLGHTVLIECLVSGRIDCAKQIVEWLQASPGKIAQQLETENDKGRIPLLELFHRNNYDSSKIGPALPWIEQWLNKARLTQQLEKRIIFRSRLFPLPSLGPTPLVDCLYHRALPIAKWITKQIGNEKAKEQLQMIYEYGETAFIRALPYHTHPLPPTSSIEHLQWLAQIMGTAEWNERLNSKDNLLLILALQARDLTAAKWIGNQLAREELIEQLKAYDSDQDIFCQLLSSSDDRAPQIDIADWIADQIGPEATVDSLVLRRELQWPLLVSILLSPPDWCERWKAIDWIDKRLPREKKVEQLMAQYEVGTPMDYLVRANRIEEAEWVKKQLSGQESAHSLTSAI